MDSLPADPDLLLPYVADLLKFTFGNKAHISEYTTLVRKHDYVVMNVKTINPGYDLLLKIAGPEAPLRTTFEQSAYLHRLVSRETTVPIAEVFAADVRCERWPWRYLIRSAIPGIEWAKVRDGLVEKEVAVLHAQLGDAVAQLHSISFTQFGEFNTSGVVAGSSSLMNALRDRARLTINRPNLLSHIFALLDKNVDLFIDIDQSVLCHDDLHRYNILLERRDGRWQLASIIDFDKAWAGHAESDLARLELWDGMTSKHFWKAYSAKRTISPGYESRRPIYQLLWCFEYAKQSRKHLADTNRLCAQLGLPFVERFD